MKMPAPDPDRYAKTGQGTDTMPRASFALVVVSILLPVVLFGLAAWQNRLDVMREAEIRVERTTRVLHEHALKIFETHQLMLAYIDERLRGFDWSTGRDTEAVHFFLARLKANAVQVAAITVTDAEGHIRATSEAFPADPTISYADRDYFKALKEHAQPLPFVSRTVEGLQSHKMVFSLSQRLSAAVPGAFNGTISISVRRSYFEDFYRGIEREFEHVIILTRNDGSILADVPGSGRLALEPKSAFRRALAAPVTGLYVTPAMIDGAKRILAYERIGDFPVVIGFGVTWKSALMPWWRNIAGYGFVAFLSSLALLFVSAVAMRHSAREVKATRKWRQTADLLQNEMGERLRVEEQLRQAQKMEAVGRLTGGVAHDFNNLLTIVIGSLDLLSRRLKDGDPRHQSLVKNAMDGAMRAAALTARLLAFARQHPLDPKPLDANALVAGMTNLLQHSLGESVELETLLPEDVWLTFADPNQLENAILNLAVNARDAMPDGGTLKIETGNQTLDADFTATHPEAVPGDYVTLAIRDSGTGMPPEVLQHAFEPFYTTKPLGKGTGLGLSQVYGFARQSGGYATIWSELGTGTQITIYLPRLRQEASGAGLSNAEEVEAEAGPRGHRGAILVVEDEELVRQFSSATLREAGYTVLEAATGLEAADLLQGHPEIALLFTDIVLKGAINGRALAKQALTLRPGLKVLYTSGYRKEAVIAQSGPDDASSFLAKPFTTAALAAKIEALLA